MLHEFTAFELEALRRLAFFMATGSGKTLLLHVNRKIKMDGFLLVAKSLNQIVDKIVFMDMLMSITAPAAQKVSSLLQCGLFTGLLFAATAFSHAGATDTAPAILWTIHANNGLGRANATSLVANSTGGTYAVGAFAGTQDFGGITLTSTTETQEYFVGRWDMTGRALWVEPIRGTNLWWSCSVAAADTGGLLVLGTFRHQAELNGITLSGATGPEEVSLFLARYGPDGELADARVIATGGVQSGYPSGLVAERPVVGMASTLDGGAVIGGTFSSAMTIAGQPLTGGENSIFLARCNADGELVWARVLNRMGGSPGILVTTQPDDQVTVSGRFSEGIDFGETDFMGDGGFLARYDALGNLVWARQLKVSAIAADDSGTTYITGSFRSLEELPGSLTSMPPFPPEAATGAYLARLDDHGETIWMRTIWTGGGGVEIACAAGGDVYWLSHFAGAAEMEGAGLFYSREWVGLVGRYRADGTCVWATTDRGDFHYGPSLHIAAGSAGNVTLASYGRFLAGTAVSAAESPVRILRQPASFQVVHAGDDAQLDILTSGAEPQFFQWYHGELVIPGATSRTLIITNYHEEFSAPYRVVASNRFGAVTSTWAELALTTGSSLPGLLWGRQGGGYGGLSYEEGARDVCTDASGAVYLAADYSLFGHFEDQTLTARGSRNFALVKYAADGRFCWTQQSPGNGADGVFSVAADTMGGVYVTGWWDSSRADFFGDAEAAGADRFLAKYDASGAFLWARATGGAAVVTDAAGSLFVIGENEPGTSLGHTHLSVGGMFAAKYDTSGDNLWLQHFPTARLGVGKPSVDTEGGLLLGGYYAENTMVGGVALTNSGPGEGTFIARFDPAGRLDWVTQGSWTSFISRIRLAADARLGVYGVTDFSGAFHLGASHITGRNRLNGVMFRLDSSGHVEWIRLFPLTGEGANAWSQLTATALDPAGNAYVVGRFVGQLNLGTSILEWVGGSGCNAYVARYDRQGHCLGARQIGGETPISPWAVAVDSHGHAVIAGDFGDLVIEPGAAFVCGDSVLIGRGFMDPFVAKLETSLPVVQVSRAGMEMLISWLWTGPELVLESADTISDSAWVLRGEPVTTESRRHTVRLPKAHAAQFFRLRTKEAP